MNNNHPAERVLLGPGPSPVPARVLQALSAPTLGHLDPQYVAILDETCELLRQVYQTKNKLTFPVSGTGMAGMECVAVNLVEPGDEVIVCVNGVFGGRMKDVMQRCGATVHALEAPWGEIFPLEQIAEALQRHPPLGGRRAGNVRRSGGGGQGLPRSAAPLCRPRQRHESLRGIDAGGRWHRHRAQPAQSH